MTTLIGDTSSLAQQTTLSAVNAKLPALTSNNAVLVELLTAQLAALAPLATQPVSGSVSVSNFPGAQAISAAALPLPAGAATSAKQHNFGTAGSAATDVVSVQGIASMTPLKVDGSATTQPVSGTLAISNFPATQPVSGAVSVSNFPGTQAVSGSVSVTGTTAISAAALPLPSGAATSAKQPNFGTAGVAATDVLSVQGIASMTPLKTDGSGVTQPVSGTVGVSGTVAVSATALPLPTGAATETTLAALSAKFPTQAAGALPVSLPTATITALTPPTSVGVNNFPSTQAVSAAALPLPSGASTETTLAAINTKTPALVSGSVPVVGTVAVSNLLATQPVSGSVSVSNFPGTQPVSGTVTANAGTNTSTAALALETGGNLDAINAKLPALAAGAIPVSLPAATVTTLTPLSSVGVNNFPATQAISATALPLPAGASTETTLAAINAKLPALSAGTVPVSVTSLPLPSGAALETGGNLATIASRTPALGTALIAASVPVTIASDQTVPTKGGFSEISSFVATTTVGVSVVASTDVSAFKWVSVQLSGTWVGTLAWQGSNDNVNWSAITLTNIGIGTTTGAVSATSTGIFHGVVAFRYFRIQVSAYTSGTFAGTVEFYTMPAHYQTLGVSGPVSQSGTWTTTPLASSANGATPYHLLAASTNNATVVKASTGSIQSISVTNIAAYPVYLKLYKKATTPAPASDSALLVKVVGCPAGQNVTISFPLQCNFVGGIGLAIVKGIADTDNTSVVAADCTVDLDFL